MGKQSHAQRSNTNTAFHPVHSLHTDQKPGPGLRSERDSDLVDRGGVCVAEFPTGRAPGQLDITLTGGKKTNQARDPLQRPQSEQELWGFPIKIVSQR